MQLYKTLEVRPSQLTKIYAELGGRYSLWERLKRGGVGAPMLYYAGGVDQLDDLQHLAADELRINIELLKAGIILRIAERTNSYFIPIPKAAIARLELVKATEKCSLQLTTQSAISFTFWSQVAQYHDWRFFIEKSFLSEFFV